MERCPGRSAAQTEWADDSAHSASVAPLPASRAPTLAPEIYDEPNRRDDDTAARDSGSGRDSTPKHLHDRTEQLTGEPGFEPGPHASKGRRAAVTPLPIALQGGRLTLPDGRASVGYDEQACMTMSCGFEPPKFRPTA